MTLIQDRLGIEAVTTPGRKGQFDVLADGETVARRGGNWLSRKLGAGYPDSEEVVRALESRRAAEPSRP